MDLLSGNKLHVRRASVCISWTPLSMTQPWCNYGNLTASNEAISVDKSHTPATSSSATVPADDPTVPTLYCRFRYLFSNHSRLLNIVVVFTKWNRKVSSFHYFYFVNKLTLLCETPREWGTQTPRTSSSFLPYLIRIGKESDLKDAWSASRKRPVFD